MQQMTPTADGTFALIARVYRRALLDARRGDRQATEWLDTVAPDWRERYSKRLGGTDNGRKKDTVDLRGYRNHLQGN